MTLGQLDPRSTRRAHIGFGLAVLLCFVIVTIQERDANEEIRRQKAINADLLSQIEMLEHESVANDPGAGGAEVEPRPVSPLPDLRFPIHPDDYLFLSSPYGLRVSPVLDREMNHTGLDIASAWRAQVIAIDSGVVIEHWPPPGTPYPGGGEYRGNPVYGGMVKIRHDDGLESVYAHLSWTRVHEGYDVEAGEVIGRVGDTGKTTGMHLHFEIIKDGKQVNPLLFMELP